jgi:hypothetical protein
MGSAARRDACCSHPIEPSCRRSARASLLGSIGRYWARVRARASDARPLVGRLSCVRSRDSMDVGDAAEADVLDAADGDVERALPRRVRPRRSSASAARPRITRVRRLLIMCTLAVAVGLFDSAMTSRSSAIGGVVATLLFLGYSAYCVQNFIRCREVHCAITGPGFFVAAVLEGMRVGGLAVPFSLPWTVFAGAYVAGMALEFALTARP